MLMLNCQLCVSSGKTRKMGEICSKLTVKAPERRHFQGKLGIIIITINLA